MPPSLSIIIPACNEEKRIPYILKSYSDYFNKLEREKLIKYKILIVINNTKDRTEEIVKDFSKKNKNIKYNVLIPGGKGFAVLEGFKHELENNSSQLIGFVDADLSTPPEAFYDLVKKIKGHGSAIASRYVKGAIVKPKQKIQRIISSRMFNVVTRALLFVNYRDTQCGAKLFTRKSLKIIIPQLTFSKWAFDIDILYTLKKNEIPVIEVPTTWIERKFSTINFFNAGSFMVLGIIRLRLLNSPLKDFIRLYDFLITRIRKYLLP